MHCTNCGVQLINDPRFCPNCGHAIAINGNNALVDQLKVVPSQEAPIQSVVVAPMLGTKWLKFWNYFSLPVGGALNLFMSFAAPVFAIVIIPISVLQFVVAYGLHYRKLWAWKWNWVVIVCVYIFAVIPTRTSGVYISEADLMVQFLIKAVLGGLIWVWPNYVYWKKRKVLFS